VVASGTTAKATASATQRPVCAPVASALLLCKAPFLSGPGGAHELLETCLFPAKHCFPRQMARRRVFVFRNRTLLITVK
jgi:hypothetical protein